MIGKIAKKLGLIRVDEFTSIKLREEFRRLHEIDVGLYSYGCFDRSRIDPKTIIGRYCSFAPTAQVLNRNHGTSFISTTPYLYNHKLGVIETDTIVYESCTIGDDVWVGHNATIAPSAHRIGRGAVIAAGAVVTKDVDPYSIVAGTPARVVRMRFDDATIARIEATEWWLWTPEQLKQKIETIPNLIYSPAGHGSAE